tara:strand:- start:234 stop:530 length:297 start_codon:yes stop_codon:yes gene_type:complete
MHSRIVGSFERETQCQQRARATQDDSGGGRTEARRERFQQLQIARFCVPEFELQHGKTGITHQKRMPGVRIEVVGLARCRTSRPREDVCCGRNPGSQF